MIGDLSLLGPSAFLPPPLSEHTLDFVRIAYGLMLLGTLMITLPHGRRFFISERWGGYAKSEPSVDALHNPRIYPYMMALWFTCGALITFGIWTLWAALINLLICRYYFVFMRWRGVLRGMGAPGFMTYWLAVVLFLLELARLVGPELSSLVLLVAQIDYALIMLSSGIYKITAGYPKNIGMELGMVNPEWGYFWKFFKRVPTSHWLFKFLNQSAWTTQVGAAFLMLLPQTRFLGAAIMIASFIFVATQIRLGCLCQMVMIGGILFFHPGSLGDQLIAQIIPPAAIGAVPTATGALPLATALTIALWTYLALLPLAHAGLFCNFYGRRSFPRPLQRLLDTYTNFFGIIIWRVFSVDVVNFFPRIHRKPKSGGQRVLVSDYGGLGLKRFNHVGESIAVTCLFTALKYYPSNNDIFRERLLRYSKTLPCSEDELLIFEYISVRKIEKRFEFISVAEFLVDLETGTIVERRLSETTNIRAPHEYSPILESRKPGTYAPGENSNTMRRVTAESPNVIDSHC